MTNGTESEPHQKGGAMMQIMKKVQSILLIGIIAVASVLAMERAL